MGTELQLNEKAKEMVNFSSWLLNNFLIEWSEDRDAFMWVERNPRENPIKEYDENEVYLRYAVDILF